MLAIRLKRVGRANLAQYRVIVQDSRRHPKRGTVVEYLGTYDPHTKDVKLEKDRIKHFLSNGAQPSTAVARLLKADGVKLPKWVTIDKNPKRKTRNPEKLRKNQSKEVKSGAKPAEEPKVEEAKEEATKQEAASDDKVEENAEEPKKEPEKSEDKPEAEEVKENSEKGSKEEPSKAEKDAK